MSNIYDIAEIAGVSIATVSKVINDRHDVSDDTKKRIRKIMMENNYIPNSVARSLTTNQSGSIGMIFNYTHEEGLNNMFFQEVIFGAEKVLGKAGFDYVYFSDQKWHDDYDYDYLGKCKNRMVDGAILLGIHKDERMSRLLESDLPVVLIDLEYSNKSTSYVSSDNEKGAYQAVEYLSELGHKKIATIMGRRGMDPVDIRLRGYKKALTDYQLSYREDWILESDFEEKSAYQAMKKILAMKEKPSAIFCQADVIAIAAIRAIKDAGLKVPEDFSIIGFDNIEVGKYITPSLTTVNQNTYQLGENAAKLLLKMIKSPGKSNSPIILPSSLVIRDSCRRLE